MTKSEIMQEISKLSAKDKRDILNQIVLQKEDLRPNDMDFVVIGEVDEKERERRERAKKSVEEMSKKIEKRMGNRFSNTHVSAEEIDENSF